MQMDPESPETGDSKSRRHELIAKVITGDQGLDSRQADRVLGTASEVPSLGHSKPVAVESRR